MKEKIAKENLSNVAGGGDPKDAVRNLIQRYESILARYALMFDELESKFQDAIKDNDETLARAIDAEMRSMHQDEQNVMRDYTSLLNSQSPQ